MTRKPETIAFWCGRLPHWEVVDGRYFVTLHLAGAIPEQGQQRIHALAAQLDRLSQHDVEGRLRVHRRVFAEMEAWLDRAEQVRHLRQPEIAQIMMEAIAFREQRQWHMFEFVVMPTHLHLFFEIVNRGLKPVLEQFKRWTGHEASKRLGLDGERFWQDEWFDHWSRSDEEDERIMAYIRRNPEKARLVSDYRDWPYGSWSGQRPRPGLGLRP
jgi:REP element-mobilizing transposase RayT